MSCYGRCRAMVDVMLWWMSRYGGGHAMVEVMLWWRSCYGGGHAMGEVMLWWRSCYGEGMVHMFKMKKKYVTLNYILCIHIVL